MGKQAARAAAARKAATQQAALDAARRRRLLAAVAVGALIVGSGVTYLTRSSPTSSAPSASASLAPLKDEPGVVHVHGLGVDPADGTLYAATHSGLFRIPEKGAAVRVANRAQDTMGFSVVGPATFIGSGHPDRREDDVRPPLLGLIESTDRGETWQRISLHGTADFHALHAAHGQVYGYDSTSGTFMVSADRVKWDRRSQLPIRDFAVSPTSAETVLATSERGLVRSADGGRTWKPVLKAPTLAVLSWVDPAATYGIGPDGTVFRSADGGVTWRAQGMAGGEPESVAVNSRGGVETLYVAVSGRGILASTDGGGTFATRYQEQTSG